MYSFIYTAYLNINDNNGKTRKRFRGVGSLQLLPFLDFGFVYFGATYSHAHICVNVYRYTHTHTTAMGFVSESQLAGLCSYNFCLASRIEDV